MVLSVSSMQTKSRVPWCKANRMDEVIYRLTFVPLGMMSLFEEEPCNKQNGLILA